jgi:toxin ParE1/3/4
VTDHLFAVEITADAESDLEAVHAFMFRHRGRDDADSLIEKFADLIQSLERYLMRGTIPKELDRLGIRDFRQTLLLHFRVIYRVMGGTVYIQMIADGRREMQSLLEKRLLGERLH